jgi:3-phenylpropionate/trans-cinnamate dioxygenase ferredoxin reductase subunit
MEDAVHLRRSIAPGATVAVVGGGYIGLEVAASAVTAGAHVTVLEGEQSVMARVVGTATAAFLTAVHRTRGVKVELGSRVTGFAVGPDGSMVIARAGGDPVHADIALVAVGVEPNVELAAASGLQVDDGIVVDEHCRTSDAAIFAAGDCTNHPNPLLARRLRLESVHNATEQAKTVAGTICGVPRPYAQIPWFWSDQYEHKLQTVGLADGHDSAVVSQPTDNAMTVSYLRDGVLLAVDCINAPGDFVRARAALAAPAREREPAAW